MLYLNLAIASKKTITTELVTILKSTTFCGHEPVLDRIKELLSGLIDTVSFIIEYPYIDRHYRDTYYSFHSSKFLKTARNCIRVHIFEGAISEADCFNKKTNLHNKYLGFFIVRPLMIFTLGRSLISPKAFKTNNFVCCLMKSRVSLFGRDLEVHGFPHIAQDMETHRCAESALWSFIEYFGSKYSQYKPLLPSQIIKSLLDNSEHRILPSIGLTKAELVKCLHNNGFQCLIYPIVTPSNNLSFQLLQIYIESGIPLLLVLANKTDAHTVLVIGHEDDMSIYNLQNDDSWIDVSFFKRRLVFIDDNMLPYTIADFLSPTAHYPKRELQDLTITSFIVPLPIHMFLVAEKAYDLIKEIFNNPRVGLKTEEKWITRLLLTGSRSFKNFILESDDKMNNAFKKYLLCLDLPKFIWICEVYKAQEFTTGYCSGLLILDATSVSKSLASILWYTLGNNMFIHNNVNWEPESKPIIPFQMCTYRNNLKGEWNQWKS